MTQEVLPPEWKVIPLNEDRLFSFENGTWTGKRPPLTDCKVLRNTNFTKEGTLDFTDVAVIPVETRQLPKKRLIKGDIIIERSGGGPQQPVGRVAYFELDNDDFCFSNFTTRLRVKDIDSVLPQFLHLYLHYFHTSGQTEKLQRRTTGIRNLDFDSFKKIPIPLPPLSEQNAIVRVLRAIQKAREARQQEIALERERKAALMQHLFTYGTGTKPQKETRLGPLPQHWDVVRLGSMVTLVSGGTPSKDNPEYWSGTIPWASPKDLKQPRLRNTQDHITEEAARNGSCLVPAGTVFIVIRGMILAKSVPVALAEVCMAFNQDIKALIPSDRVDGEYLLYALEQYRTALSPYIGSSAHGTKRIGTSSLESLLIPLPPLEEQRQIARGLRTGEYKIAALTREVTMLRELFDAILGELMSGRLSAMRIVDEVTV